MEGLASNTEGAGLSAVSARGRTGGGVVFDGLLASPPKILAPATVPSRPGCRCNPSPIHSEVEAPFNPGD